MITDILTRQVPNRSSGNPIVSLYRVPAPGNNSLAKTYEEPGTSPTADIKGMTYFKRDHRRNYPKVSSFDQTKISGLLSLGSQDAPRVAIGNEGHKQLATYQGQHVYLSDVLKQVPSNVIHGQVLGVNGEPVLAPNMNKGKSWKIVKDHGMYSEEYPCRLFDLKA